jgi:hypothetical protein
MVIEWAIEDNQFGIIDVNLLPHLPMTRGQPVSLTFSVRFVQSIQILGNFIDYVVYLLNSKLRNQMLNKRNV